MVALIPGNARRDGLKVVKNKRRQDNQIVRELEDNMLLIWRLIITEDKSIFNHFSSMIADYLEID